jgi:ADP-heptose:LPS heptosyltransferase
MTLHLRKQIDFYVGNLLIGLIYPLVRLAAFILRRDHSIDALNSSRHVAFVKLLGGGSIFIALPAIEAIKKGRSDRQISIVCSRSVEGFAKTMGVFDRIVVIDDRSLASLLRSGLAAAHFLWREADLSVDLEVHSRLTTLLTTAAGVRNRIGLVDHASLWRRRLYTHAVYVNPFGRIFESYDALPRLIDGGSSSVDLTYRNLRAQLQLDSHRPQQVALGVGCSDLALERQLSINAWSEILQGIERRRPTTEFVFIGGPGDRALAEEIRSKSQLKAIVQNKCGELSLRESLRELGRSSVYLGIDSALLHFARALTPTVVGFWGPTRQDSLLRPLSLNELQLSRQVSCSPCVHFTQSPPCRGQNHCMSFKDELNQVVDFVTQALPEGESADSRRELSMSRARSALVWVYDPDQTQPRALHV